MTVTVKHADDRLLQAICDAAVSSPKARIKVRSKKKRHLTENGFTPEFEAEILAADAELKEQIRNGTARVFSSVEEFDRYMEEEYNEDEI